MNDRDKMFAEEYLFDLDPKNAALRAGFAPTTARNAAAWINPEKPGKPAVRKYIDQLMAQRSKRTGISADRVLTEIGKIAFANPTDILDMDKLRISKNAERETTAAVASITIGKGKNPKIEVRMADKLRALELIGKHLGMFTEKAAEDAGNEKTIEQILQAVSNVE